MYSPDCYEKLGTLVQMNPPIRGKDHQEALWDAISQGVVDIIGSDHAPHTLEEKGKQYPESPSGMPGVQTLLPIMLNHVNNGKLSLDTLVNLVSIKPTKIFGIKNRGAIKEENFADLTVIDMHKQFLISNSWIASRCKWTPFNNYKVKGFPVGTVINGNVVSWESEIVLKKSGKPLIF
jgi:dihydroorotase